MESIDTLVIGGGQAGLATSYYLGRSGTEHLVLERSDRPAHVWRDGRWDSFALVTPNETLRMPGSEYNGPEPGAFMARDDVIAYFDTYVEQHRLPIHLETHVDEVALQENGRFRVSTSAQAYEARNVVVATGYEQHPKIPSAAAGLSPDILQLHSSEYRNPRSLAEGAVLVVGSAQSGAQIAEDLYLTGRKVYLCVCNAGRAPRSYRGRDVFMWLVEIGFFDLPADRFPMPRDKFAPPHVSGARGGHTLNLHQFARDGVTLLGHFRNATGDRIDIAPDLHETLGRVDAFEQQVVKMVDGYIAAHGLDQPTEELPRMTDGFEQPIIESVDLRQQGIGTVIWATGYTYDYSLVRAPVCDTSGFPIQTRGVAELPGLFFVGMPWMPGIKPGTLIGVGEAALHVVESVSKLAV